MYTPTNTTNIVQKLVVYHENYELSAKYNVNSLQKEWRECPLLNTVKYYCVWVSVNVNGSQQFYRELNCHRKERPRLWGGWSKSPGPCASVLDQEPMEGVSGVFLHLSITDSMLWLALSDHVTRFPLWSPADTSSVYIFAESLHNRHNRLQAFYCVMYVVLWMG